MSLLAAVSTLKSSERQVWWAGALVFLQSIQGFSESLSVWSKGQSEVQLPSWVSGCIHSHNPKAEVQP